MRFITIALLAVVALTAVRADQAQDIANCITALTIPCKGDAACSAEFTKYNQCLASKDCMSKTEPSSFADCIRSCDSTNESVQKYFDDYANCINGTILSFAAFFLALFVMMF